MIVEEYDESVASAADTISIHSFRFIRTTLWPEAILTPMYFGEGLKPPEPKTTVIYTGARWLDYINKVLGDYVI